MIVAIALISVAGTTRLRVDFSSAAFYGDDDDASALHESVARWGPDDAELVVVIETDEPRGLDHRHLERVAAFVAALEHEPHVRTVESLPGRLQTVGVPLDRPLPAEVALAIMDSRAVPLLLSEDRRHQAVVVRLDRSSDDLLAARPIIVAMQQRATDAAAKEGLTISFGGLPAIRSAFFDLVLHDQLRFVPLSVAVMGVVLFVAFRRVHAVLAAGLAAGLPTLILVGTMGWLGEPLGLLNQAYFTLIPALALAGAVHVVGRVHEEQRAASSASCDATIITALGAVGPACAMAAVTTAAGFASLAVSDMPILRRFGLWAAWGVSVAYATSVTALPLFLSRSSLPNDPPPRDDHGPSSE